VAGPTREISGSCSLLVRVVGYKVDENLRVGKWRILDGKGECGLMSDLELLGGSPNLCQLRTVSHWAL
jgi:hypothetical protein